MPFSIADDRTLGAELDQQADRHPDKSWLTYEALDGGLETHTYADFVARSWQVARVLHELGVRPGERILLHLGNCPEFLLLWFGAARLGAVIVPTNPLSADPELEYLCQPLLPAGGPARGDRRQPAPVLALALLLAAVAPAAAQHLRAQPASPA